MEPIFPGPGEIQKNWDLILIVISAVALFPLSILVILAISVIVDVISRDDGSDERR